MYNDLIDGILKNPSTIEKVKNKYSNATAGKSWWRGFKKRHQFRKRRINGKRASIPEDIELLMEPIRKIIMEKGIPISRIYNWDEAGLYYRKYPKYTLARAGDTGAGGKDDKNRITLLFSVNGDGSERSIVAIGKSKTPRGTNKKLF